MKARKIRIVVILLLIIFFGLLILFGWSSNIYEGLQNDASFYKSSTKTLDFTTDSNFKIDKITTIDPKPSASIAKTLFKLKTEEKCYFISIYYFYSSLLGIFEKQTVVKIFYFI